MDHNEEHALFSGFQPVTTSHWEEKILADLKGADYEKKLIWHTGEGIPVKPYYREEDFQATGLVDSLPAVEPYVRGVKPFGNRWIIREDIMTDDIAGANTQALEAIRKGCNALGLKAGMVDTHRQMTDLLHGLDLNATGIHFISSKSYPLTLELFIYEVSHLGEGGDRITGSLNFDPISYLLLHGNFYSTWNQNLDEAEYLLNVLQKRLPHYKAININGHYFQEAGASVVQEIAFSLASANEYLASLTDKGLEVDAIAPHMQLSLAIGPNYFFEIAKIRAARLLWARMVEQYHPSNPAAMKVFINSTTARWNKTVYDPYVNMLRTTTEAMSAAIGCADSVTVRPFDLPYSCGNDFSRRIARNQQLILMEEAYLHKVADPAAGSYYIESLTRSIAHHAWDLFRKTEGLGGMIESCKSGFVQAEAERSRQQKMADVSSRKQVILGTNQYPNLQETAAACVESSRAEIAGDTPYPTLRIFRASEPFEVLRGQTERYVDAGNTRPSVFLFTMGNLAMLRARAGFATNFFGCAGYEIIDNAGFNTVEEGLEAVRHSGAKVVVVCGSDEDYPAIVPVIAREVKLLPGLPVVVVAGYPKEHIEVFKQAGVDDFIHVRSNLLDTLRTYQARLGVETIHP